MADSPIDVASVTAWIAGRVDALDAPLSFDLIAGGHSNLTFAVTDQRSRRWVLRRPPLFQVLESAHDMAREHHVISALSQTDVPVPTTIGLCEDLDVNGRPFYVMDFIHGTVLRDADVATQFGAERLKDVTRSLVDTMAKVHAVDVDQVGLGNLGRKEDYIGRQLRRWMRQHDATGTAERPEFARIHEHLSARIPDQPSAGLVHGDYRLDNCLVDDDAAVCAVLDWELCTLGDTRADVAQLLTYWARPGDAFTPIEVAPTMAAGFPERDQLLEWYQQSSGHDLEHLDFFMSFCSWRLAAILEGVYSRYVNGAMGDAVPDGGPHAFINRIDALVAQASTYAEAVA